MIAKNLNLGIAFLLELCMLAAFAYWGFQVSDNGLVRLLAGAGVPLVTILIWARFMAPNSAARLTGSAYLILKSILFGLAAIALAAAGQPILAGIFVVVAVVNQALLLAWKQETLQRQAGSG